MANSRPYPYETVVNVPLDSPSLAAMDIDAAASKGKGKTIVTTPEENDFNNQEASASLAKIVFILKLLTVILLMYPSSVNVLLRKDAEVSGCRAPPQKGSYCVLHYWNIPPYSSQVSSIFQKFQKGKEKINGDWMHKLATGVSQFLAAACVRSTEARRRVFTEISNILNDC